MTIDNHDSAILDKRIDYRYDSEGLRIREQQITDSNGNGDYSDESDYYIKSTAFVFDSQNPTGLPQIREKLNYSIGTDSKIYFTFQSTSLLGLDILGQAYSSTNNYTFFLYDGHGSNRAWVSGCFLVDFYYDSEYTYFLAYDAYGNPVGFDLAKVMEKTSILYSGEQTDSTGLQYLRARYYDPRTGRFSSLDPYAGNMEDPQSLHKYLVSVRRSTC